MRVRISWGGGTSETWHGSIKVDRGSLTNSRTLSLTSDSPGSILLTDGSLTIRQPTPTNYGGVDVSVEGDSDTELQITMYAAERPDQQFETRVRLDQLTSGPQVEEIDDQQNRLTVARAPGDELRVHFKGKNSLIFKTNEHMSIGIEPNLTGINSRSANCRIKICPARKTTPVLWSNSFQFTLDENGSGRNERMEIPVPVSEGVYDLILELEPNWYQVPFNSRKQSLKRHVQFVVLDKKSPNEQWTSGSDQPWTQYELLDVYSGRSLARPSNASLQQLNRLVTPQPMPLGNERRRVVNFGQQKMMQLDVGGWHAIQIPVGRLHEPYTIEVEYLANQPTAIGTSIIQPDAGGQIPNIGFDSGVSVQKTLVDDESSSTIKKHKIVFWPSTKRPLLLIANRHEKNPVVIGNIRFLNGPTRLPPANTSVTTGRSLMAFYEVPLFTENFGVSKSTDPVLQQQLDDWQTFYEGADRFIQHLKANSYGGAFITVVSDGSSIYPSQLLDPTPKFDSGTYFSNGQDPKRKDVLELLFRMFDREGLKLVPTLAMSAPLPAIEAARDPERSVDDFDLVDFRQQTLDPNRANAPRYNPLNVQVQKAVTDIVEELAERYKNHNSFKSVALVCRPDTYTQLMGQYWGYDPTTINRFVASLDGQPVSSDIHGELLTTYRDQWRQWRAAQISSWYFQMMEAVKRHIPDGKLVLAPVDIYRNEEISSALSPSLHMAADFEQVMLRMGFTHDLAMLDKDLVLLNPNRVAPSQSLASRRVELQVENSPQSQSFFKQSLYPGAVISHRMSWAHFAELQQLSPFGPQQSPLMRLQQLSPAGSRCREPLAHSLKKYDSRLLVNGGMALPIGPQDELTDFVNVFSQLPDETFSTIASTQFESLESPIAVRQFSDHSNWYFYAVNSSPWPVKVKLSLSATPTRSIQSLSQVGLMLQSADDGQQAAIVLDLEPFGLVGGWLDDESVSIDDYVIDFPENADQPLRAELRKLQSKLAKATKTLPLEVLSNADFSPANQPSLNGWNFGQQPANNIRLQRDNGIDNSAALLLTSEGQTVWIRSNKFAAPKTGRLSVSVWLKTEDAEQQPPLRIAIEGQSPNFDYYRFGTIGALAPDSETKKVSRQWQRFAVHFDDVPVEAIEDLRIGFDMMGAGKVWIDDIEVYDRWFDGNDTKAITQMLASASYLLSRPENIDQCRRILGGYWPRFLDEHFPDSELKTNGDAGSNLAHPKPKERVPITPNAQSTERNSKRTRPNLSRRHR